MNSKVCDTQYLGNDSALSHFRNTTNLSWKKSRLREMLQPTKTPRVGKHHHFGIERKAYIPNVLSPQIPYLTSSTTYHHKNYINNQPITI